MKRMRNSAITTLRIAGNTTWAMIFISPAPSMRAASSISCGNSCR